MPIDREQTLKQAEKLLRQGRLDAAIAEYARVVAECPSDWATANLLGDLFVRAGRTADACRQYLRVADHLAADGFVARAAALYKKVIKLNPVDEHALIRSAELAAAQGLVADLRAFLNALFQHRLKQGDREGARALARKRVSFDPNDIVGRLDAARMFAEAGDAAGAAAELRTAGLALEAQHRLPEAARALRESLRFDPRNDDVRHALVRLLVTQGDADGALDAATTPDALRVFLALCDERGLADATPRALERLATADPGDAGTRLRLARACLDAGDVDAAERWLDAGVDPNRPDVALARADIAVRRANPGEAAGLVAVAAAADPACGPAVVGLARRASALIPDGGAAIMAPFVAAALARGDATAARAQLTDYLSYVPGCTAALRQLIDVCVEGGFAADLKAAQIRLADALILRGEWQEALAIAEDLLVSDPGDPSHAERARRALVGLGRDPDEELARLVPPDADAGVDELLKGVAGGQDPGQSSGVLSEDFSMLVADLAADRPSPPQEPGHPVSPGAAPTTGSDRGSEFRPEERPIVGDDLRRLFEDAGPPGGRAPAEAIEIDLSDELDGLELAVEPILPAPLPPETPDRPEPALRESAEAPGDLDAFFHHLRAEAAVDHRADAARRLYDEGVHDFEAGRTDQAADRLREAARDPGIRFEASRLLARIARQRNNLAEAVEWLERAAEAPAPSTETWQQLLDELASTLELAGEEARALAVLLELRAALHGDRDLDRRIEALSARQAGDVPTPSESSS